MNFVNVSDFSLRGLMLTAAQCRAARGLLGWTQDALAANARVSIGTVRRFEGGSSQPIHHNLQALQSAMEDAGIEFADDGSEGVRKHTTVKIAGVEATGVAGRVSTQNERKAGAGC